MLRHVTTLIWLATFASLCSAGLQVPFLIINLSPYDVSVDMTLDENCIKHDFNPVDLQHYYDSWESNNLGNFDSDYAPYNDYLQQYKTQFGVPKLRDNLAPMSGTTTIPGLNPNSTEKTAPYMVFETEMDGSGTCFGSHSGKSFALNVNGQTEKFTIEDPPTSEWTLTMYYPENTRVVLGSGGHAAWGTIVLQSITAVAAVVTLGAAYEFYASVEIFEAAIGNSARFAIGVTGQTTVAATAWYGALGTSFLGAMDWVQNSYTNTNDPQNKNGTAPINKDELYLGFPDIYNGLNDDQRRACVLGQNIIGNYDCLVAGTSLIIQGNGKALAVPLPNIYRAWN